MSSASSATGRPSATRRLAALAALAAGGATVLIGLTGAVRYPAAAAITVAAAAMVGLGAVMFVTTGGGRVLGLSSVVLGAGVWCTVLVISDAWPYVVAMIATDLVAAMCTLDALRPRPYHPPARPAERPTKPFIVMNSTSGNGKVEKFDLVERARKMGAEVMLLEPGLDVVARLRRAVDEGADLLGAAGGDGTQALVAQVAAEKGVPMVCIPAGTRNHFALDLGLDRDDPSTALWALGHDGEEITIDLGEVGGRPFVNNVSLGLYAEIVAHPEYRASKIQTVLATLPEIARPDSHSGLSVNADGHAAVVDPQLVQVANNPYARPEDALPTGTRPRLDTGRLGIEIIAYRSPAELRQLIGCAGRNALTRADAYMGWAVPTITVSSDDGTVRAGVDGEFVEFPSPLEIRIRPGALRMRVPKERPGQKRAWPPFDFRMVSRMWAVLTGRGHR